MATISPPTRPARRPASVSSAATPSTRSPPAEDKNPSGTTLVAKGSISRTSPSPKAIPPIRRTTASSRPSSSLSNPREATKNASPLKVKENGISKPVDASVAGEAEMTSGQYDELKLRIQDLDSTVSTLATDNAKLQTSLTQAESRLTEFYNDQARAEQELSVRHELAEKLRTQLRELEKEKRDLTRRYNEQTAAFEAERQSFYDNEQHLKSRIQALGQSRKEHVAPRKPRYSEMDETASIVSEAEFPVPEPRTEPQSGPGGDQIDEAEDNDPAEMTALKLELSTLSTSHASLQSTLHLLQSQLLDLQRVNAELQEENEGWKVLVQQRTLAGTFDILTLGGARSEDNGADDTSSMKSTGRNTLDKVSEMDEIAYEAEMGSGRPSVETLDTALRTNGIRGRSLDAELAASDVNRTGSPASRHSRRRGKALGDLTESPKGESLADLPITGPGLDLAAELGRAQNADGFIDGGHATGAPKKIQSIDEKRMQTEIEGLKADVKSLKDANKALSLYASKIIDRIIATEGFEDVLAVDFTMKFSKKQARRRPASMIFGAGPVPDGPRTAVPAEKLTTFESIRMSQSTSATPPPPPPKPAPTPAEDPRRSRRSMSFDWRGFSLFGGGAGPTEAEKKAADPSLRPLTLRPGAPAVTASSSGMGARKLETVEDEEDRKERERLRTTMRLMGIDPTTQSPPTRESGATPPLRPISTEAVTPDSGPATVTATAPNRWSFFGRRETTDSANGSSSSLAPSHSASPAPPALLTAEALQQAEAESHIAALDAREKVVKEEIAKGSGSGFTELSGLNGAPRRRIGEEWRSRRSSASLGGGDLTISRGVRKEGSSAGSASTVWSAGKDDD